MTLTEAIRQLRTVEALAKDTAYFEAIVYARTMLTIFAEALETDD